MDIQPEETTQPISDDQELAKVLAGVSQQTNDNINYDAVTMPTPAASPVPNIQSLTDDHKGSEDLESIKRNVITELRPLVNKLDLSPEEKFDTYLLLIRSTDDITLIEPAHAAARNIADESKRAQALLDIIKEIDFLSNPNQPSL